MDNDFQFDYSTEKPMQQRHYEKLMGYAEKLEKSMKFPMFKKETTDKKYHGAPFRAANYPIGEDGIMRCPNGSISGFYWPESL